MDKLVLSTLAHTWILDLDGTIVKHNGYKIHGKDFFLPGAREFLENIPEKDIVIFITARSDKYRAITENFLKENKVRYANIIFNVPCGERILINDDKPSGLKMGYAINLTRDSGIQTEIMFDGSI